MSDLRILRTDDLPSNACSCGGTVTWKATDHGPRAEADPCSCGNTDARTGDLVQDARNAMMAREGDRFTRPAAPRPAAQVDANEGPIERARREMIERQNKRFATRG